MAKDKQQAAAQAQAANPQIMNVNKLKTLLSYPKAEIPFFMEIKQTIQSWQN